MTTRRRLLRAPNRALIGRAAAVLGLALAILFLWTLSSVYEQRKLMHRHQAERELQTIGRLQAQAVGDWRASRLADASALTDDSLFAQAVARWRLGPDTDGSSAAFVQERLRILQERARYSVVSFVAADGTGADSSKPLPAEERRALAEAIERAAPTVVEPRRAPYFAFPFLSLMAPIFDGARPLGAVWLVVDVRTSLYPLLSPWPTASETAQSVLVQAQGDNAVLLTPMRNQDRLESAPVVSALVAANPVVQAVAGARGLFYGRDEHGDRKSVV